MVAIAEALVDFHKCFLAKDKSMAIKKDMLIIILEMGKPELGILKAYFEYPKKDYHYQFALHYCIQFKKILHLLIVALMVDSLKMQ